MASRLSRFFGLLIAAGTIFGGCKGSTTDSNGNNNTHIDIGDSIPRMGSNYLFQTAQLDLSGNIISGTLSPANHSAIVVSTGLSQFGKSNTYCINDDGDTCYYTYESNSD